MQNTNQTVKETREELLNHFKYLTNSMLNIYATISSDTYSCSDTNVVNIELDGESVARAIEEFKEGIGVVDLRCCPDCGIGGLGLEEKQCPICTSDLNSERKVTDEVYSFENDMKEVTKKKMELMNLISRFAIDNEMSFEQVAECVEEIKKLYLTDGLIRK